MLRQEWKEERCCLYFYPPKKRRDLPEIHVPKQGQLVLPLGLLSPSPAGPHLCAVFSSAHQLDRARYLEGWDSNWQWETYTWWVTVTTVLCVPKSFSNLLWNSCCPLFSGVHWTSLENSPKYETFDWEGKIKVMVEESWKAVCWSDELQRRLGREGEY